MSKKDRNNEFDNGNLPHLACLQKTLQSRKIKNLLNIRLVWPKFNYLYIKWTINHNF